MVNFKETYSSLVYSQRGGEYKKRFYLRGFSHYPHRGVDAGQHGCKTTEYRTRVQTPISPVSIKCNVLRESLSEDSQNIPCATLKRRWSWVIFKWLWLKPHKFKVMTSVSDPNLMESVDLGMPNHGQLKQCCGYALVSTFNADPAPAFYLNADPDPEPGTKPLRNADLCGSAFPILIRIQDNQINADPRWSWSTTLNKSEICNIGIIRAFEGRLYCTVPCRAEWPPWAALLPSLSRLFFCWAGLSPCPAVN